MNLITKGYFLVFCLSFLQFRGFCQSGPGIPTYKSISLPQLVPAAPTPSQVTQYGTIPVGLFTGTAKYSVDLFNLRSRQIVVPLNLNYSSNGVKVDMPAGRTGTNWVFEAGGVVTRAVYGDDDFEGTTERPAIPASLNTPSNELRDFLETVYGEDMQPDEFSFNFLSYSGKFIIRENKVIFIPYQPELKVEYNFIGTQWNFLFTTPDGVKFYFGGSQATETSRNQNGGISCAASGPDQTYQSAWHLTKIVHPQGDSVEFKYRQVYFNYLTGISQTITRLYPTTQAAISCPNPGGVPNIAAPAGKDSYCYPMNINTGKILGEIITSIGVAKFFYNSREDMPGDSCLKKIEIYNNRSEKIKVWEFGYTYAQCNSLYNNPIVSDGGGNRRLFLTSLSEISGVDNTIKLTHTFEYNDINNLPSRLSFAQDHYGYFNGKQNSEFVQATSEYNNLFQGRGGNRSTDFNYSCKGMLTRVNYPTGGFTTLEYEANLVPGNLLGGSANQLLDAGGVRVRKITSKPDSNSLARHKFYFYRRFEEPSGSSGLVSPGPYYFSDQKIRVYCNDIPGDCNYGDFTYKVLSSNSVYSLYASPAGMVSYTHVIEADDSTFNNGRIVHEFVNSFDAPPAIKFGNPISNQRYSNFGFNNGAPLRRTYFNLVGGVFTKLKEEAMTYRILIDALAKQYKTYQVDTVVLINKIGYVPCTSSNMSSEELNSFDINIVYLFSHFMYQDTMVVTEYTPSGNMVSRFLNFYDNRQHLQKTGELTYNSSGELIEKLVKYAYDFSGPGNVYEEMQNQNLVADPVEEKVKKQGTLLVTDSKTYIKNSTTPLRFNIQKLTQKLEPAAVEDRLLFTKYDLNGNILEVQKPLDVMQTYLYGYNAAYPVAKVVGANHTTVAGFINQSVLDNPFTTDEQMRTELNKIRTGLANTTTQVITYTYKPLVGVTSATDANGRTTYYEYDELHRLLLIRDHDKRIIKKICYNYTGQSEGCAIYYNAQQSGAFTRSCAPPYTGSQVTYTVAAGTYLSTTSQSQADAYAVNDVNANGQAYANANGTCTYVCGPGNCAGQGKKCVNNVCETGIKIYTDSQFNPNTGFYECTYHYEWSDGLWSQNFVEQSAGDCVIW